MVCGIDNGKVRRVAAGGALGLGGVLAGAGIAVAAMVPPASRGVAPTAPTPAREAAPAAVSLEKATQDAAATASPSIVKIESAGGLGSGVVVDARGYIVTNYHVLAGQQGRVDRQSRYTVTLADGASYQAAIAGTDAPDDLAVLKISAPNLRALPPADSSGLRVGQFVLAVGNPLGYSQTVTFGIVSTLRRTVAENGPATFIPDMIQISAPINPGNSGGALVDLRGRLVGIPVGRVSFIAGQIIKEGKVTHSGRPYLGVAGLREVTPAVAAQEGLGVENGVLLDRVVRDGPADRAGLRAGDVVVRLDGRPARSEAAFGDALARLKPGARVPVTVKTEAGERAVTVTLGELPIG